MPGTARSSGEEEVEPASSTLRPRDDDTIEAAELDRRRDELVVVDARLPSVGAASRTRSTGSPAASRARSTRRGTSRRRSYRTGELVAYCGSGVTATVAAAPPPPRRPRRQALSRLVERVGAARPAGRARLGGRRRRARAEVREVRLPAVRDLRCGEPDEEHRRRRPSAGGRAPSAPLPACGCPCGGCTARTP